MFLSWILVVLFSFLLGVQEVVHSEKKSKSEPFQLPKVLLDVIHCNQLVTKETCIALNLLLQFLFHELRDTEKVRLWFRKKLCLEFEELLSRSAIGKMVGNIRILEIDLGSEFPVINGVSIDDVSVNKDHSHIDTLDLKLDVNYSGGFRLVVEANMLLGKAALISIKVNELYGEGRLQFTRLPYSHWSFAFCNEPNVQLQVESHFQGRPFHQITNFISNQIKKSLRKKHTLPNYKIRYKPFFNATENVSQAMSVPPGQVQVILHKVSRLNEVAAENSEVYCTTGLDHLPWIEIVNYGKASYYVLDIVVTKKKHQGFSFLFRQEFLEEKSQVCVVLEEMKPGVSGNQDSLCRDDIILSVDGKKVSSVNQAQKFIKSAAFQFTVRVERKIRTKLIEENSSEDIVDPLSPTAFCGLRKRKESESESGSSSPTASASGSPAHRIDGKRLPDGGKSFSTCQKGTSSEESADSATKLLKTGVRPNRQVILFDHYFTFQVKGDERFLNINVRYKDADMKDNLLGFINIPLVEVQNASDTLRCLKLKPPDMFSASNIRSHKLLSHNGFIPLLCYGDIVLTIQYYPSVESPFKSVPEIIEPTLTPEAEIAPGFLYEEKKHDFIKTHFQTSTQCEFCGKKIWLKDAEKCRDCDMTCHKKCVVKCKAETICTPRRESTLAGLGTDEEVLRATLDAEGAASSRESTPQPTPTKKRLGNLLATVASASRGLKRVGSANNLALPGDSVQNSQSRSLPPSPQQSPGPSRKASLPLDLNEEIAPLLQALMKHGSDQDEVMDFAKETGKTLYEELDLIERRDKINEMLNQLKGLINEETEIRFSLVKEEQIENDATNKAKIAFLIGKSDEKVQALTVLMMHFCSGLQHIQDLEDQEKENKNLQEFNVFSASGGIAE
ncbi:hypothetical protein RUM43_011119 [Polyplax serrata]|uniref:PDZ domain-containing protein 8 n=1 Tax=Polyplax serrata TaxID=468196 RepID=A0AAN8RTD5_POLSC